MADASWSDRLLDSLRQDVVEPGSRPDRRPAAPPRYEIRRKVGEGAMADVYEAFDRQLDRRVALKRPKPAALADAVVRERFEREGRSAARFSHPNVVTVYDVAEEEGHPYLVMEFVEGLPLGQHLRESRPALPDLMRLVEKVARAVQYVHEKGVVHRDLKPANILVTREGEPKVADFGLAHWLDADRRLTRTGAAMGTPLYMAPEQVRARPGSIDARTDVYALGAILYEAATGRPAFDAVATAELYSRILGSDPTPARSLRPDIPADLDRIIAQAMAKEPGRRYPTAQALADDIGRLRRGEPVLARPPGSIARLLRRIRRRRLPILAGAAVLALAALTAHNVAESHRRSHAQELLGWARDAYETANRFERIPEADVAGRDAALEEAAGRAEEAERLAPDQAEIPLLLGRIRELQGRRVPAEAALRRAIARDPGLGRARFALARFLLYEAYLSRPGPSKPMVEAAAREIREAGSCRDPIREESDLIVAKAMLAHAAQKYDEVIRLCDEGLAKFRGRPGTEELLWMKSQALPPAQSLPLLDEVLKVRPGFVAALLVRSVSRIDVGQFEGAVEDCTEALRREPGLESALSNRCLAFSKLDRTAEALADLETVLARRPASCDDLGIRGTLRHQRKEWSLAIEDYRRALELAPADWPDRAVFQALLSRAKDGLSAEH